jgi:hypothetical protein
MKSVEDLLDTFVQFSECVIQLTDPKWSHKLVRVTKALCKQGITYKQSHTTEGNIWIYLTK